MRPPSYQAPTLDPLAQAQEQVAQQQQLLSLQDRLKGDTSSTLAQYGALKALSGTVRFAAVR